MSRRVSFCISRSKTRIVVFCPILACLRESLGKLTNPGGGTTAIDGEGRNDCVGCNNTSFQNAHAVFDDHKFAYKAISANLDV